MPSMDRQFNISAASKKQIKHLISLDPRSIKHFVQQPLTIDDADGNAAIEIPIGTELMVWDNVRGPYKRTSRQYETRMMTFFVGTFQLTINRSWTARILWHANKSHTSDSFAQVT